MDPRRPRRKRKIQKTSLGSNFHLQKIKKFGSSFIPSSRHPLVIHPIPTHQFEWQQCSSARRLFSRGGVWTIFNSMAFNGLVDVPACHLHCTHVNTHTHIYNNLYMYRSVCVVHIWLFRPMYRVYIYILANLREKEEVNIVYISRVHW